MEEIKLNLVIIEESYTQRPNFNKEINNKLIVIDQPKQNTKKNIKKSKLKDNKILSIVNEKLDKTKANIKLNQEISQLTADWINIMSNAKIQNEELKTFTLKHIKKEEKYGWSGRIYAPWALDLDKLETYKPIIEFGLKCEFSYRIPKHKEFAMFQFIYPNLVKCNDTPFEPCKVEPYELCMGVNSAGEFVVFNVNLKPQILIAGQARRGKNGSAEMSLVSLIHSCSEKEIELYLFQCAKNDLIKYRNCKQVKCFILGDFKAMEIQMDIILEEINRRTSLLEDMMENCKGTNLYDYNKLYPQNPLPYIYIYIDEFLVLMLKSKDKKIQESKEQILEHLALVAEMGGAYGINYCILHQKPEMKLCPSFLKNMSSVRICYGFEDESCGRIVLGEKYGHLALKLPARKAIYSCDDVMDTLYTTDLRNRIKMFIEPSEIKKIQKTIETPIKESTKAKQKNNQDTGGKVPKEELPMELFPSVKEKFVQQTFDKVDPNINKEKLVEENAKKIDGWVPYSPSKTLNVIDQTNMPIITSKPVKGGG